LGADSGKIIGEEAVEAAAKAVESAVEDDTCPNDYDSTDNGTCLHCVRLMLRAAVPHIEAAIRDEIVEELAALYYQSGQNPATTYDEGWKDSNEAAARVARGGSR
jgi:hypothetical protein